MALIGYARVSSVDQNIAPQVEKLRLAGCELIREERISGSSRKNRPELTVTLDFIRKDDVLVVTRIDRLARSISDLLDIIALLKERGASLRVTEQPLDTSSPYGRLQLGVLGVVAEFENDIRRERQREGMDSAKRSGKYRGRRPDRDREERVLALHGEGLSLGQIAAQVGMSRSGVNHIVKKQGRLF